MVAAGKGLSNCGTAYNVGAGYVTVELVDYTPPAQSANWRCDSSCISSAHERASFMV
jgi:hypothetical protein